MQQPRVAPTTSSAPPSRPVSMPAAAAAAPATTGTSTAHAAGRGRSFTTAVSKGEHGIGLDLGKTKEGLAQVLKLKEMPLGVANPATTCSVPLAAGDVITAVNNVPCSTFAETVKQIRASEGSVMLTFTRT